MNSRKSISKMLQSPGPMPHASPDRGGAHLPHNTRWSSPASAAVLARLGRDPANFCCVVFSEVGLPLYGVLGSSPCSAPGSRQHALVTNTAFGGCTALPHRSKLHP